MKFNEVTKLSLMNFFVNLYFLSPVIVFFYDDRGVNFFQIMILESVLMLTKLAFEVPTGALADKFGRKFSLVACVVLQILSEFIFFFAYDYTFFLISTVLFGISLAFLSGTVEAIMYDYLKSENREKDMKKAMGTYNSASLIALVVAPIIGSFIAKDLQSRQFEFLIILTMITLIIGGIFALMLKDTEEKHIEEVNPFELVKDGTKLLRENKSLKRIMLLGILTSPVLHILNYLYQPYFKEANVEITYFGIIFSISVLLAALFSKYAYKVEELLGMKRAVFLATILPGILYVLMGFIIHPIASVLLFITLRSVSSIRSPLFSEYKNIHIKSYNRATVLSLISMVSSLYAVFFRLIVGKVADIHFSYAFIMIGAVIIFGAILLRIDEGHVNIND